MKQSEVDKIREQDISPIEKARLLGLNTSNYLEQDGEYWCSPSDAQIIIKAVNPGKEVTLNYVRHPHRNGHVKRITVWTRNFYDLTSLLNVTVKSRGVPKGSTIPNYKAHGTTPKVLENMRNAQRTRRKREKEQ